jgi:hypothetical protein
MTSFALSSSSQKHAKEEENGKDSNKHPDSIALVWDIKDYMATDFHHLEPEFPQFEPRHRSHKHKALYGPIWRS